MLTQKGLAETKDQNEEEYVYCGYPWLYRRCRARSFFQSPVPGGVPNRLCQQRYAGGHVCFGVPPQLETALPLELVRSQEQTYHGARISSGPLFIFWPERDSANAPRHIALITIEDTRQGSFHH